jgi:uncharacterized membrane protein
VNVFVLAQAFGGRFHHGSAHPWLGLLFWLFLVAVIGVAIWTLARPAHSTHVIAPAGGAPPVDPAMDILRSRFARGEIDSGEFAARAAQLAGHMPPPPPSPPSTPTADGPPPEPTT